LVSGLKEVRFHGRGGQGAWTASLLLAQAALEENKYIQSFPAFGPERAGAPITAFTRISNEKIQLHSSIYEPDVVAVLDPTLLGPAVSNGIQKGTKLIVNTDESADAVREKLGLKNVETWTVDATTLALDVLGRPITNTAMLGTVVKATDVVKLESLIKVIKARFEGKIGELNADLVNKAYEEAMMG
jgi:2-oxoacid:acceptor oxidoreductase gamma subunit (pyruvate/2-ketoisovalerate family)